VVVAVVMGLSAFAGSSSAQDYKCLPAGYTNKSIGELKTTLETKTMTVREALIDARARCSHAKLVDGHDREIKFFVMQGCWGNPPAGYLEILDRQDKELALLRQTHTVIEIPCERGSKPFIH
jgi:hypothetical protein